MSFGSPLLCLRNPFSTSGPSLPGLVQRDLKGSVRSGRWVYGKLNSADPYMGCVPAPLVCRVLSCVGLAKPYHFQGVKGHCEKQASWRTQKTCQKPHLRQSPDRCLGRRSGELWVMSGHCCHLCDHFGQFYCAVLLSPRLYHFPTFSVAFEWFACEAAQATSCRAAKSTGTLVFTCAIPARPRDFTVGAGLLSKATPGYRTLLCPSSSGTAEIRHISQKNLSTVGTQGVQPA